jgi:hypothetical protein
MNQILNFFFLILISIFLLNTFKYYSSNNNIEKKIFNRNNIDKIIESKTSDLIILTDDTNDVIEFNDGFSNSIRNDKKRSFWNLLKSK